MPEQQQGQGSGPFQDLINGVREFLGENAEREREELRRQQQQRQGGTGTSAVEQSRCALTSDDQKLEACLRQAGTD